MSLHLFVIDKAGVCSPLGAFVDRHEARPVFAKSGAVAGIYTLDNGVVLSTLAEPSEGQLRRLKEFALATLAGSAPAVPPPAPEPAPRRAKPLRSIAARAADLDDENERLRRAPSRIERVASARRIGLAEAAHVVAAEEIEPAVGPEDFGGTDFPDEVADAALREVDRRRSAEYAPARPRIFEPLGIIREDEGEPDALAVGIGATTEPPRCRTTHHDDCDCQRDARGEPRVEAPLPVAFEPPVVASDLSAEIESLRVQLADVTARAVAAEQSAAEMQAVLDGARAAATALDTRAERAEGERDALASSLRERSEQLDAARRDIAARDRTIAKLLAAKAHPVVRVAPKPRRVRKAAVGETPLGTIMRRLSERARGVR